MVFVIALTFSEAELFTIRPPAAKKHVVKRIAVFIYLVKGFSGYLPLKTATISFYFLGEKIFNDYLKTFVLCGLERMLRDVGYDVVKIIRLCEKLF